MQFKWWLLGSFLGFLLVIGLGQRCAATEVRIELSSGEFVVGQWMGASADGVQIMTAEGGQELSIDQLVELRLASPVQSLSAPPIQIGLIDGTVIRVDTAMMDDRVMKLQPSRQSAIAMPIKQVRSIRLRPASNGTDAQWLGLAEKESRSDMMVIRRANDQLDPIEGVVIGMDASKVLFQIDGEQIDAPRERLEGLLLGTGAAESTTAGVALTDIHGSTFSVDPRAMSATAEVITFQLSGQVRHQLPIDQVRQIRWASGRVMLATQSPASKQVTTYLETNLPAALLNDWFAPIADGDDLVAVANSRIEFRVESGFQTLAGSVGRDSAVDAAASTIVRVFVDDEMKWEQTLTDAAAKGFQIPVAGARRVGFQVLAGDDGDVGDQVRFLKPRLMK